MTTELNGSGVPSVGELSTLRGSTAQVKGTWIGSNYGWPNLPNCPTPSYYPVPVPQKSDAPFMLATLAQLLDEGKITEETFARLAERLIQQVK